MKRLSLFSLLALMLSFAHFSFGQCTTESGTIVPGDFHHCLMGTVTVEHNDDEVLDADDVLKFVIHDGTADELGIILSIGPTWLPPGTIPAPTDAVPGVTYQIAAVAGNPDGAGGVDLDDPCLSFSGGATVIFYEAPILETPDPVFPCEDTDLEISVLIDPPGGDYLIEWGDAFDLPNGNPISVTNPGHYIAYVTDQLSGCQVWDTVIVTGAAGKPTVFIDDIGALGCGEVQVEVDLFNGQGPFDYLWNDGSTDPFRVLTPGTWCVTVTTSTGCEGKDCFVVPDPVGLTAELVFNQGSNCNSSFLEVQTTGGTGGFEYQWSNGNSTAVTNFDFALGNNYVTVSDGAGCQAFASFFVASSPGECGQLDLRVFGDMNLDCDFSTDENLLGNFTIEVLDDLGNPVYAYVNTNPNLLSWSKKVQPGDYTVTVSPPNDFWESCQATYTATVANGQTTLLDLGMQPLEDCYNMVVDVSVGELNWCNPFNRVWVYYCNDGTADASDAYVELQLEPFLSITAAGMAFTDLGGDLYRFDLDDVPFGDCGQFWLDVLVDCDATLGATHCLDATIFPNEPCMMFGNWSGASLVVSSECDAEGVHFFIENVGTATMTIPLNYVIIEDAIMFMTMPDEPSLEPGQIEQVDLAANGSTWRIEVEQEPFHPGFSMPSLALEGCDFYGSQGFVNLFPQDDLDDFVDIECVQSTAGYDPNDKQGFPLGVGENDIIRPGTALEYRIRFQNTGTDTAETVVIRDTLSEWLDPLTIQAGAASHDYRMEFYGNGPNVAFIFEDIMLLDSNLNEPASHGFVDFKIWPKDDVPLGTDIYNSAAIYFDYNPPIFTNTTHHRIDTLFATPVSWVAEPLFDLQIAPHPVADQARVYVDGLPSGQMMTMELFDAFGKKMWAKTEANGELTIHKNDLPSGLYLLRISSAGELVGTGKVVFNE